MEDSTERELTFNYEKMLSYVTGMWVSQTVRAAAALSLAEQLADGAASAADIARFAEADPAATFRLLRACASLDLVAYDRATSLFSALPLLDTLHGESPNSLKDMVLVQTAPGHWLSWGRFTDAVRTGRSQVEEALGADVWGYFGQHPDEARMFGAAMTNISTPVIGDAVALIDTSEAMVVADIGGADGAFVLALLRENPRLAGVVLDLPHAVDGARAEVARQGLSDRVLVQAGDFFDSVPKADVYLLKFILHDWDDAACVSILRNCRDALMPGGRVVVVEMVIDDDDSSGQATRMDMNMLAMAPGQERELGEFDALLSAAGLRRVSATPARAPYYVIEAVAA